MKNMIKVSVLREQLLSKTSGINKESGIYCWWFKKDIAESFISKLQIKPDEINKIQKRIIDGETYWALYLGISKDMLGRAKWHVTQKDSISAIKRGFISTLRQTISALLNKDMSQSADDVNKLMDDSCYWEWEYDQSPENRESAELSSESVCYPLNIKKNKTVSKDVIKYLIKKRRDHRK